MTIQARLFVFLLGGRMFIVGIDDLLARNSLTALSI
jgi:hypothetical protein